MSFLDFFTERGHSFRNWVKEAVCTGAPVTLSPLVASRPCSRWRCRRPRCTRWAGECVTHSTGPALSRCRGSQTHNWVYFSNKQRAAFRSTIYFCFCTFYLAGQKNVWRPGKMQLGQKAQKTKGRVGGDSHLCPCSSMAVPLRPPMSHMMMEWSELPENSTLCDGSQHSAVTLPWPQNTRTQRSRRVQRVQRGWRVLRDHADRSDKHSRLPRAVMTRRSMEARSSGLKTLSRPSLAKGRIS